MRAKAWIPSPARLAYLCSRVSYEFLPAGARSRVVARLGRSWQFFCPACELPVGAFSPLPDFYVRELEEHDSDLRAMTFETCNSGAYQCPHCGATDRDRLYAMYLAERVPTATPEQAAFQLLDIAPAAPLSRHIKQKYRIGYRTADRFMKNVDDRVDIMSMGCYGDSRFDAFICSHVLEHVADDRKAMAELWRVLKPGGWGIAMVPISLDLDDVREDPSKTTPSERCKYFGQADHVRLYSRGGFTKRLREAGFAVREFGETHFGAERLKRSGISTASVLYVVEKPSFSSQSSPHQTS